MDTEWERKVHININFYRDFPEFNFQTDFELMCNPTRMVNCFPRLPGRFKLG